jgi:hypothetical protein
MVKTGDGEISSFQFESQIVEEKEDVWVDFGENAQGTSVAVGKKMDERVVGFTGYF